MKELRTIILAAGKGTRMKSSIPKVVHCVGGKPIIQYILDIAKAVGSLKIYAVLGHKIGVVKKYLPRGCVVVRQKRLLGTADAVRAASAYLKNYSGDVLILCGDTPLLKKKTVLELCKKHRSSKASCTFLTALVDDPKGYGRILRNENEQAIGIREERDVVGLERDIREINVGVYCFNARDLFEALREVKLNPKKKEFYFTDIVHLLFLKGFKVETIETDNPVEGLGINTRLDLVLAEKYLRKEFLLGLIEDGVSIVDPETTFIDSSVKIGKDTVIRPFSVIEENVRVGTRCRIGPFARLRPGTVILNDVEVGNFTEISRTKIGDKTIMKHFSFLGDAWVGSNVNIGAGTVTANFDGKDKNRTVIADRAFIGSDSILVAPVKVGKRAMTGAGSVVTKGKVVPPGAVAMGVPAVIIPRRK